MRLPDEIVIFIEVNGIHEKRESPLTKRVQSIANILLLLMGLAAIVTLRTDVSSYMSSVRSVRGLKLNIEDLKVVDFPRLECHLGLNQDGRLVLNHGTPGNNEAMLFSTPPVSDKGPYKFGITVSKKLVIFRELDGGEIETVWMSH